MAKEGLLLIIESPGKLKKITQYCKELGYDAVVKASMGHIRELFSTGEDGWGFAIDGNKITSDWSVTASKKKNVADIKSQAKGRRVILATDGDREGESIAWHLAQVLKLKNPDRITYAEITKPALKAALDKPRKLDDGLVGAALGRAHLDKMVGYSGSKRVVWALDIGAKSMGRVQSSALWILVKRELEIRNFKPTTYFSLTTTYGEGFKALYRAASTKASESVEVVDDSGEEKAGSESDRVTDKAVAEKILAIARSTPHQVTKVESKKTSQNPPAALTTSTLQQVAGSKLKFSPDQTMGVAQKLYEGGHITYMRTDSVALSEGFCDSVRQYLEQHDPENVPTKVAKHGNKEGAQEAHEAIRPTDINQDPKQIKLSGEELALYTLIWQRAIATQCAPAQLNKTCVSIQSGSTNWEVRGQSLAFAGYTKHWNNLSGDSLLPVLKEGQTLKLIQVSADQKQTSAPGRYTEPKLVQEMEKKGIGRPSTYASTIKTLKDREYIKIPKAKGMAKIEVTSMGLELMDVLDRVLPNIVRPQFTAEMEKSLDQVASGKLEWEKFLIEFYEKTFSPALIAAEKTIQDYKRKAS